MAPFLPPEISSCLCPSGRIMSSACAVKELEFGLPLRACFFAVRSGRSWFLALDSASEVHRAPLPASPSSPAVSTHPHSPPSSILFPTLGLFSIQMVSQAQPLTLHPGSVSVTFTLVAVTQRTTAWELPHRGHLRCCCFPTAFAALKAPSPPSLPGAPRPLSFLRASLGGHACPWPPDPGCWHPLG